MKTNRERSMLVLKAAVVGPMDDTVIEIVGEYCEVQISREFGSRRSSPASIFGFISTGHVLSSFLPLFLFGFVLAFLVLPSADSFRLRPADSRFSCYPMTE